MTHKQQRAVSLLRWTLCLILAAVFCTGLSNGIAAAETGGSLLVVSRPDVLVSVWKTADIPDLDDRTAAEREQLAQNAEKQTKIASEKTDEQGVLKLADLTAGTYLVTAENNTFDPILVNVEAGMIASAFPKTDSTIYLKIVKTDAGTKEPVTDKDFEFTVYEDERLTQEVTKMQADKSTGTVTFPLLLQTVWIKETRAPYGYEQRNDPIKVNLDNGQLTVNDDVYEVKEGQTIAITYENTKKTSSPVQVMTSVLQKHNILFWTGTAALAAAVFMALKGTRKNKK